MKSFPWTFRTLLFLPLLILLQCSSSPASDPATEQEPSALGSLLEPNEEGLPYPVYSNFEELAPLFAQDDGRTYVINFWATWCAPCVAEMPYFEQLAEETDPESVQLVMVSLDFAREVRGKLQQFVAKRELKMPVVALTDGKYNDWIGRVDPDWGGAIPVTVVYRGDERRFHASDFADYAELRALVEEVRQ